MAQRVYISDTNIWIDFGRAGLLDALFALPFTFVSTDFVVNELSHPDPDGLRARGLVVQDLNEAEVQSAYSTRWRTRFHADGGQCSSVMADSVPR